MFSVAMSESHSGCLIAAELNRRHESLTQHMQVRSTLVRFVVASSSIASLASIRTSPAYCTKRIEEADVITTYRRKVVRLVDTSEDVDPVVRTPWIRWLFVKASRFLTTFDHSVSDGQEPVVEAGADRA